MAYSDACVYPYPAGSTSVRRLALEAKHLGIDRLVCVKSDFTGDFYGVKVVSGAFIAAENFRNLTSALKKEKNADIIMVKAGDAGFNRSVLNSGRVHILKNIHLAPKKAFDDVCARSAIKNGIAIDIDISVIIEQRGIIRQKALTCYGEILKFQRKYKFPLTISTGARSYMGLRSVNEITSICSLFGMSRDEVCEALSSVDELLNPKTPVEVLFSV
ncbi:ribonuclease P [Methanoplanus sp. FWC-SCC4]|uniref:Ribonuclease P protein component 3 n=1 Tax=Methanochimaera problematica TaxID=2609417 RepID=A0AA97I379_9EURY|nr:RNase P subunit p30 family protein [Methanoplanus sp. FWC-SCC4]WOF16408.1 ribonuclease P [Methanoplanus sp. FWC-SCC4]